MPVTYDAFISYSRQDSEFVYMLVSKLTSNGFRVFYDDNSIAVGDSLAESLFKAIESARYVIVVMSPAYFRSIWGRQELQIALNKEFETNQTKVIPLLYQDCDIPPLLETKVYADFRTDDSFDKSFPKLISVLSDKNTNQLSSDDTAKVSSKQLGTISQTTLESVELKIMIEDLKTKVEAFIDKSELDTPTTKNNFKNVDPKLCFIVMPFGIEELNDVYEYFLKPSIENDCKLKCQRGDDVFGSNVIMEDIRKSIEHSRVIVADLTGRNPNVFYEVGIAHTLNKDVLLLCQSISDVPFDLRHRRVLVYDYTPKGCKKLEKAIVENISSILNQNATT